MDYPEFFELLITNFAKYFLALLLSLIFYFPFIKRQFISIFDPFFLSQIYSVFACSVVFFLMIMNSMSMRLFTVYFFTQLLFFIGLNITNPPLVYRNIQRNFVETPYQIRYIKIIFLLCFSLYFVFQMYSYARFGIPIFAESRLNIYDSDFLSKVLKRINEGSSPLLVFFTILILLNKRVSSKFKFLGWGAIIFILITSILSGARSAVLTLVTAYFCIALYSKYKLGFPEAWKRLYNLKWKLISFMVLVVILVVLIGGNNGVNPIFFIGYRLVASGDCFFMSYPNNVIDNIWQNSHNILIELFASPLRMIGLIQETDMPESIGFTIMKYHNPHIEFRGPNPRHNIFGYLLFGQPGCYIYSFIIGSLYSISRNLILKMSKTYYWQMAIYFLLMIAFSTIEGDYYTFLSILLNIIIIGVPIMLISSILAIKSIKNETYSNSDLT
jgi:hypothetical protein